MNIAWTSVDEHLSYLIFEDDADEHLDTINVMREIKDLLAAEHVEFADESSVDDTTMMEEFLEGETLSTGTLESGFQCGYKIVNNNGRKVLFVFEEGTGTITYYREIQ